MRVLRPVFAGSLVLSVAFGALATSAGADTVTDDAVDWLVTQQQADGGFEHTSSPAFETPDVALAIATAAQTTSNWDPAEARAAVAAVQVDGTGPSALNWLDNFATSPDLTPGTAAKLILISALPLGDDPTAYDPAQDLSLIHI